VSRMPRRSSCGAVVQVPAWPADAGQGFQPAGSRGSEYAMLSRQVRQAGLLDRRLRYYAWKMTLTGLALAAGWAVFAVLGDSWWQLGTAALLAVIFAQIGFLGHDAGHRQVFRSRRANYVAGVLCGNLCTGLSIGWWTGKHNRHHAHPNTEGADPDIMIGVLAFSGGQARASRGIQRLAFRYQAYLVVPMLFLQAVSLHAASIQAMTRRPCRNRAWEATLLGVHAAGYLTAIFLILSPARAAAFILVQQGLFGFYLACSFAPNHKGMPILAASDKSDFLRRQVLTSRDVRGGWLTDFALGGLNYQIEHHLFPSMPRPSLRRSQPLIAAFCAEHDLAYCQTSLPRSYAQALRHLNATGKLSANPRSSRKPVLAPRGSHASGAVERAQPRRAG
jgi:fatty acid desaturase